MSFREIPLMKLNEGTVLFHPYISKNSFKGVKKVLNSNFKQLDGYKSYGLKADYFKDKIKIKSKKVLERLNKLKKNGKKNTY